MHFKKKLFLIVGMMLFFLAMGMNAYASLSSSMTITPTTGLKVGDTFTVQFDVSYTAGGTGTSFFNSLDGMISFPKTLVNVSTVTAPVWNSTAGLVISTTDDAATANGVGVISFSAGTPPAGIDVSTNATKVQPLLTITFTVVGAGSVTIGNPAANAWVMTDTTANNLQGAYDNQTFTTTTSGGAAPTITNITPNTGTTAGGTSVTIAGTDFVAGTTTVTIGGNACTGVTVASAASLTCTTPAGTAGAQDVVVTVTGQTPATLAGGFTYAVPPNPTVTTITPNTGSTAGGTAVTIDGASFVAGSTTVTIGGAAATGVTVTSATSLTCTTPAGTAGAQDVVVTVAGAAAPATLAGGFTYVAPPSPTVTTITPNTGSTGGGTAVTIDGTNFLAGSTTVTIGGNACTGVTVTSATSLTCTTPAGTAGAQDVVVTVAGAAAPATLAGGFTYVVPPNPTVTTITPNTGSTAGGTTVTIDGTNFVAGSTTVTIGGNACTGVNVTSATSLTCTTPAGTAGAQDVIVTVAGAAAPATLAGGFTYTAPLANPTITSITPNTGTTLGGTTVTIAGNNFVVGTTTVTIGGTAASGVNVTSATSLTCVTPVGTEGAKDVVVTVAGAATPATLAGGFTYIAPACVPPTITANPTDALTTTGIAAGTMVTFTGSASGTWTFSDGGTATGTTATHTYNTAGSTATVTLTTGANCSKTVMVTVQAAACDAAPAFTVPAPIHVGTAADFALGGTGTGSTPAWLFSDDGGTVNPHTFANPGTFTVSLTTTGTGGCTNTVSKLATAVCATTATLTPDVTAVAAGGTVTFTVGGAPTSFTINYGDGSAPSATLTHVYTAPGTFNATVTATIGGCQAVSLPVAITVTDAATCDPATADLANISTTGSPVVGTPYALSNATTGDFTVAGNTATWAVTNLLTGAAVTPTVSTTAPFNATVNFTATGDYLITLTTKVGTCTSTATRTVSVGPAQPKSIIVAAPSATSILTGTAVTFSNQNATFFVTSNWTITNQTTGETVLSMASSKPVLFTFPTAGTYLVELISVGGTGDPNSTDSETFTVSDTPAVTPAITNITTTSGGTPQQGTAAALLITGTNMPANPQVWYTTGACPNPAVLPATGRTQITVSNAPAPTATAIYTTNVTFAASGTYCVFICDSTGANCIARQLAVAAPYVNPGDPYVPPSTTLVANFNVGGNETQVSGTAPFEVKFTNTSTGSYVTCNWTFGDGETGTECNPTHVYKNAGNYTVKLTVAGFLGLGGSASKEVTDFVKVTSATCTTSAVIAASPLTGPKPLTVNLDASTSVGDKFKWEVNDTQVADTKTASYTFANVGTYTVRLTVTDAAGGCSKTATATITVTEPLTCDMVTADFTAVPTSGARPLTVNFDASASANATGFAWTFGDNQTGTGKTASHTFAAVGTYTVTLTTTNSTLAGCQKTATKTINVTEAVCEVTAEFTADKIKGEAPLIVRFDATKSMKATSFAWTFGDGESGSGVTAEHTFTKPGTYTVTLTAKDDICTKTATQAITVDASDRPSKPTLVTPANGDTPRVSLTPTLTVQSNYSSPANSPHAKTRWQIATDSEFKNLVFDVSNATNLTSIWVPDFMLMPDIRYYWRAQFIDNRGYASDWASPFTMLTVLTNPEDQNDNGVPEAQELTDAASDIDGNKVSDITDMKNKVAIFVKMGSKGSSGLKTTATNFAGWLKWIDMKTLPTTPAGYDFPWGAMTFRVETRAIGDSAVLTIYFSEALPAGAKWFNYNQIEGWKDYSQYAAFSSDRKVVTVTLKDGGVGDADGAANAAIVDPAAIGIPITTPIEPVCLDCDSGSNGCFISTVSGAGMNTAPAAMLVIGLAGIYFSRRRK